MNARPIRRTGSALMGAALAGTIIAGGLLAGPGAAQATSDGAAEACEITGGTLSWGVKESFRSYISGTIANGSWETSDGATYETPDFGWSGATGSIDPATGTGTVSFTGTVHFTGHDGVLDLTIANPTIEFEGDGKAALMLDTRSTDTEGEVVVDAAQQWVGDVSVGETVAPSGDALALADLPAVLTSEGVKAFAGFYEAGQELDPLNLDLEFAGCDASGAPAAAASDGGAGAEEPQIATPAVADTAGPQIPWLPIGIGGAALFVIGLTLGLLIGGRKRQVPASQPVAPQPAAADAATPAEPTGPAAP
ncbi:HtaA domain-containing protein [Leucobacter allii]|uniref:HtaA domain-containing protein n=1 Tax=Leucobacter allii TaxID=2932247 RepID=UPI001FD55FB3|nr:HtaA domain-containing protein [Leucobacter allii]UOR00863.1 HtaA domain-containing protein [Leucobacter allii]